MLQQALDLAQEAADSWIASQILKEFARCELEAGLIEEGLLHAESALRLCSDTGLGDLAVSIGALRSRLLLAAGRMDEALAASSESMSQLRPAVELAHLVPFALGLVLSAHGRAMEADRYLEMAHDQLLKSLGDLPADARAAALAVVPAHREVVDAWSRRRPRLVQQDLARIGAPIGRPLEPDERVSVTWTLHLPSDDEIPDAVERRRARLTRLLLEASEQRGAPTVHDLAGALQASVATVRRDLAALRRSGRTVLTRGTRGRQAQ